MAPKGKDKTMGPNRLKNAFRSIGAVLLVLIIGGLIVYGVFVAPATDSPFNETQFKPDAWTAHPRNDISENNDIAGNLRAPMAADVKKRIIKQGMVRSEVRSLLGKPDTSSMGNELAGEDNYSLGHSSQMSIGQDQLIIRYNKAGKVISTTITGR
jgi:hypothetical protein